MNSAYRIAAVLVLLWIQGCQGDQESEIQGDAPVVIELVSWSQELSFPAGPGHENVLGTFVFVDPFADPERAFLLIRECGGGEIQREELPVTVTPPVSGVGTFSVGFNLSTDCDPGTYAASLFMEDEEGNVSNYIVFTYELTAPP